MKKELHQGASRRKFIGQTAKALIGFMILPRFVLGGKRADGSFYTPPSDLINLGFIGTGKQGNLLAKPFLDTGKTRIHAISEVYQAKAEKMLNTIKNLYLSQSIKGNHGQVSVHKDFRELLALKEVDAVVIATPDHWHAAMAVKAAEAGKDIYCEKPLSLTIKEGRAMVNATRKHGCVFQTGSMQRSWSEFRQVVELIRNGYIGDIQLAKVSIGPPPKKYDLPEEPIPAGLDWMKWLGPNAFSHFNAELAPPTSNDVYPNWRNYAPFGGGMMTDWGAHMFDIVQWALDMDHSGPVEVAVPSKTNPYLTYKYANGTQVTHQPWEWSYAVHFIGSAGDIKIQRGKYETNPASLQMKKIGAREKQVYKSLNHYEDFIQSIKTRRPPICDVEIGHRTASMCTIGNIAYELNRDLHWDPSIEKFKNDEAANALLGRKLNKEWGIQI